MSTPERPPPRSPLATARPWDLVAGAYAAELAPMFQPYAEAALALADVVPGAPVADVACGPGTLALLAAERGYEVDALDLSPAMIAGLDALARARGLDVRGWVGDGLALPWADAGYLGAFSLFGLMYFPDRARGYRELARVLVPGGRVAVASWLPLGDAPVLARAIAALGEVEPMLADAPRGPLTTAAEHQAELAAAGFHAIRVERVDGVTPFPSAAAFFDHLARTSAPMALAREAVGPERWPIAAAYVRAALTTTFGPGPLDVALPAWVAVATR